jgi:citrate lyase subunit beta/citryl-CoA lyase
VKAAGTAPVSGLIVPKVEHAREIRDLEASLADVERAAGRPALSLVIGIESALGVVNALEILSASERASGVYFGADDFASDVGARRTQLGDEVLYARSHIVLTARLADVEPIDQGVFAFRDDERFLEDSERGRDLGYRGKLCVHPRQVPLAHRVFTPSTEELEWSRHVLNAYRAGVREGRAAIELDGVMVDGPLVRRAASILASAGEGPAAPGEDPSHS